LIFLGQISRFKAFCDGIMIQGGGEIVARFRDWGMM